MAANPLACQVQYGDDGYKFQRRHSIKIVLYYRKFMFQLRLKHGKDKSKSSQQSTLIPKVGLGEEEKQQ
jgi:hypothetical protein